MDPADPLFRAINARHRVVRDLDQLIGLCTGVMADGHVSEMEARMLQSWIASNYELREQWPANVLLARLDQALEDGKLDSDEERALLKAIMDLTGVETAVEGGQSAVTTLPVDDPAPDVTFEGRRFVVTGNFAFGSRKAVTAAIDDRGGSVKSSVSGKTDYLVIGHLGSSDWRHSSFGSKIQNAIDLKSGGASIAIVTEGHWFNFL